jgi:hypothetical protein
MDTNAIMKKEKVILALNLIVGVIILVIGIFVDPFGYRKTLVGISVVLLGMAGASVIKVFLLKKSPSALAEEYDERIVAAKNRADAVSLRIIRYILMLVFLFYAFTRPEEIFESLIWWIILVISLLTILLPSIIMSIYRVFSHRQCQ